MVASEPAAGLWSAPELAVWLGLWVESVGEQMSVTGSELELKAALVHGSGMDPEQQRELQQAALSEAVLQRQLDMEAKLESELQVELGLQLEVETE